MAKHLLTVFAILIASSLMAQPPSGTKWTRDGNGYYAVVDNEIVQYALPALDKKTIVPRESLIPKNGTTPLSIRNFFFSGDDKQILIYTNTQQVWRYDTRGDYWLLNLADKSLKKLGRTRPASSLMFAKFSPDGEKVAYVSGYNLYVEDIATGKITALTTGGSRKLINGTFDWVYEEEFFCRDGFRWSPDGKKIAYWQINAASTKDYLMINNTDSVYPSVIPVEYPIAGEPPSPFRIGVVDIATVKTKWMSIPTDPVLQSYVPRMEWAATNNELIVQHINRRQNQSDLLISNATSGAVHTIYSEKDAAWIDVIASWDQDYSYGGWDWLNNGKEFIWASEKDGWRHLYRISRDGKSETLITRGNYDVMDICAINERTGYVYFFASPDNATQKYLYRAKLDGSAAAERLTPADQPGTHGYEVSVTGTFARHSFSNHYTPAAREWVSLPDHTPLNGDNVKNALAKSDKAKSNVELFTVRTEDGIEMDAWMVKPAGFDPSKKYPVVFYVYTEPWGQEVKDQYNIAYNFMYKGSMSADGYIYVAIDNRGTPVPKGREWRKSIYRKIGQLNIHDQAMAAREILKRPYMDTSRVAVWGWSGGGTATLHLMFRYPEIYKTGIAIAAAGNTFTYDNIYQERYFGLPHEAEEDYIKGSAITYAKHLKGNLLLIHGTGDDNVHYNNAEMLINELIANGKQFQMMSYPNRTHSLSEGEGTFEHLQQLYTDYLRKHCAPGAR